MPPSRRFPPPWSIEDIGAAYVVKDSGGQKLAYVYYEEEPGRRSSAKLLSKDEARRIAANVAKLAEAVAEATVSGGLTFDKLCKVSFSPPMHGTSC
jgi:hypothetical protein